MIKITNNICNNKSLCNIINKMNAYDKGLRHYDCNLNFNRPNFRKGYLDLLLTMSKLKTFTWEQLLMSSSARENVVKQYDVNIKCFVRSTKRFGLSDVAK